MPALWLADFGQRSSGFAVVLAVAAGGFGGRLALPRAGVAQVVDRMRPLFARGQAILAGIRSGPKKAKSVAFADDDE